MVKAILIGLVGLLAACGAKQTTPPPQVRIEQNGLYTGLISSDETAESCAGFRVDERIVMEAIESAIDVTERVYQHELVASNCTASGTFASPKNKGRWTLDRACRLIFERENGSVEYKLFKECVQPLFYELDVSETSLQSGR